MPKAKCKLCGRPCGTRDLDMPMADLYRCPACGDYETVAQDGQVVQNPIPDAKRHLISAYIRAHCDRTGRPYQLSDRPPGGGFPTDLVDLPVQERLNRLLLLVADRSTALGETIHVDPQTDWTRCWTHGPDELTACMTHLRETKLLEGLPPPATGSFLTVPGWSAANKLRGATATGTQAFVAMAFSEGLEKAYTHGIEPALTARGYAPWRSDKEHYLDKICDRIIVEIRRSRILVADVTMHRPGVYFEAGFAMGLQVPVIWTCRRDHLEEAHFDTRQYPHIVWDEPPDLRSQLEERVLALFAESPPKT